MTLLKTQLEFFHGGTKGDGTQKQPSISAKINLVTPLSSVRGSMEFFPHVKKPHFHWQHHEFSLKNIHSFLCPVAAYHLPSSAFSHHLFHALPSIHTGFIFILFFAHTCQTLSHLREWHLLFLRDGSSMSFQL